MKKLVCLISVLMLFTVMSCGERIEEEYEALKEQFQELRTEKAESDSKIAKLKDRIKTLESEKEKLTEKIGEMEIEKKSLTEVMNEIREKIADVADTDELKERFKDMLEKTPEIPEAPAESPIEE